MDLESLEGEVLAGRFKLGRLLGEGGYGAVFEAEQLSVSRRVAVKVLHPRLVADGHNFTERFRAEAVATSRLSHSNSVIVYDFGEDPAREGLLFLAMEYLEGRSLNELIQERGALELELSVHLLEQIAASLHDAHGQGIVHRDVKPHNVMLIERDGDPHFAKVIDFGIAKVVQETTAAPMESLTRTDTMIGTPHYMAPEQIHGDGELDGRTDQYALGITAYKMLTGRTPFDGGRQIEIVLKHLQEDAPPVSQMTPHAIPGAVDEVLSRALAKEPSERYATILEFAQALRQASQEEATTSAPVTAHIDVDVSQDLREEPPTRPLDAPAGPEQEGGPSGRDPAQRSTNILFPLSAEEIRERERQMLESQRAAALEQTALAGPRDGPSPSSDVPPPAQQTPRRAELDAPPALSSSGPVRVPVRQEDMSEVSEETGYTQAISREEVDADHGPSTIKTLAVERPATAEAARPSEPASPPRQERPPGDTASIGREEGAAPASLRGEETTGPAARPGDARARNWLLFGGVAFAAALISISVAAWALRDQAGPGEPAGGGELAAGSPRDPDTPTPEGDPAQGAPPEDVEASEEDPEPSPSNAAQESPERPEPPADDDPEPIDEPSPSADPAGQPSPPEGAPSEPGDRSPKVREGRPPSDQAREGEVEKTSGTDARGRAAEPASPGAATRDKKDEPPEEERAPAEPTPPKTGEVRVVIIPGGTLHVDGERREVGPDRIIELRAGSHELWVEFTSGTRSPRRTVRVRAGERADVRFSDF